ncbi:ABC transporter ATP-binding protein, partial [Geomonas sp.]|uniref:ABC transporter ATP-binding protein n=1 Tax=Geomonas sp. TaxID=2651584 RepID=UPI002B46B1D3
DLRPGKMAGEVGVLFQNPARQLFADSVREEVAFTVQRLGHQHSQCQELVEEALSFCGVEDLAERAPLTLSFGEQHRVALASVLAPRPRLLLLDEPFAGLDMAQRRQLLALFAELPERFGTTLLIATHDALPDAGWADRSLILENGRLADATA